MSLRILMWNTVLAFTPKAQAILRAARETGRPLREVQEAFAALSDQSVAYALTHANNLIAQVQRERAEAARKRELSRPARRSEPPPLIQTASSPINYR